MVLLIAETTYVSKHRAALIIDCRKKGALNASYIAALIDADLADQRLADVNGWWATGAARLARGSGQPQYLIIYLSVAGCRR